MAKVFRTTPDVFKDDTRASDVEGWDSLSHLILITALEKKFDVAIPTQDANAAQNVGELVDLIARSLTES